MLYQLTYTRLDTREEIPYVIEGPAHRKGELRKAFVSEVLDLGIQLCEGKGYRVEIAMYWPLRRGYPLPSSNTSWAQTSLIDQYTWAPAAMEPAS